MTTVINIKDAPKGWMINSDYVYIGRVGRGFTGTWGNPFQLYHESQRLKVLDKYIRWLGEQPAEYLERMDKELRGKILVCFCKPRICHGDYIAAYVDREINDTNDSHP